MAVGLPAAFEEMRRYNMHFNYLSQVAVNALNALGWRYYALSPYQFSVEIKMSLLSWGEKIGIYIYQDGTVQVRSECSFPVQWFDWGRNKKNVSQFFAWFEYSLSQMAGSPGEQQSQ
jgi:hypothetical protein